ncbi:MAG: dihydrodipicolinate synthase family protein [Hyphomicrobiales bacterium]|nr:MAG: dihydrodipicolinate synthase family protein [Hyphomicrobiales bacterium]
MTSLNLPTADRTQSKLNLSIPKNHVIRPESFNRTIYAAAHVVADPLADIDPWLEPAIDWDKTIEFREQLWSRGLGVAEAMDTAQRGMGLNWELSLELIKRSIAARDARGGGLIACGAGTDHLTPSPGVTIDDVIAAYEMQCEAVEAAGGRVILMASRALVACAQSPDDYKKVYGHILSQLKQPAILHWLGEMFDPALQGYWGADNHDTAMDTAVDIVTDNASQIDGIKISLLSAEKEIKMRRRLPASVLMYTGDDFNYPDLIEGDEQGHSHALLGIFDAIAPAAAAALTALGEGRIDDYHNIFKPTVPLSRHIFKAPTRFYKTGIVFLAYLNGFQDHFTMISGQQSTRSALHLAELIRLADTAGALINPDLAASRAKSVFLTYGIEV